LLRYYQYRNQVVDFEAGAMRTAHGRYGRFGYAAFLILCGMGRASAGPIGFVAGDADATSLATMPNSVAASTAWQAAAGALGAVHLIDFESPYPSDPQSSLLLAPGVTLSIDMQFTESFTVSSSMGPLPPGAFITTPGGSFYAGLTSFIQSGPTILTFHFTAPIQAFGLYVTGRGQPPLFSPTADLSFNDPQPQTISLPNTDFTGQFISFTDAGATIYSVTVTLPGSSFPNVADTFAFDDVRWVLAVPEPGGLPLMLTAIIPTATLLLSRRRSRSAGMGR
jgi:hypothetical protein